MQVNHTGGSATGGGVDGGGNNDTVNVTPTLTLASLIATAETINLNGGSVSTTGDQVYNGAVTLSTATGTIMRPS